MDAFEASRIAAAKLHDEALAGGSNSLSPPTLIARAIGDLDLVVEFADPADPVLKGARALYDAQSGTIVCDSSAAESDRLLLIAHELGHVSVDGDSSTCRSSDVDVSRPTEEAAVGIERVEDYGVRERRELCANVFAREFLLPRAAARRLFVEENLSASDIASRVRLPKDLVRQQLLDALLLPPRRLCPTPPRKLQSVTEEEPFNFRPVPGLARHGLWYCESCLFSRKE
jgi:DNA helicase-2/ATP-dependent DNA helicase PcrA